MEQSYFIEIQLENPSTNLKLAFFTAVVVYCIASLIRGEPAGMRELSDLISRIGAQFR